MKSRILLLLYFLPTIAFTQSNKSILFLGNSYTYVNNLPQLLHDLAITTNDTLYTDTYAPGGYTLQGHSADPNALAKINYQPWDYVVLQEQSQLPSFSPAQVAVDVYPYAKILVDQINANDSCTKTLFYMTWGRKYGDASNCPFYPPVCTFAGMQDRLRQSYLEMADSNLAWVSPVGAAFCNSILADSMLELYQSDFSHPSLNGSYLAACVFYARIYKKKPEGNSFTAGLDTATAHFLQHIAKITVLDSISLWNEGKFEPAAAFSYTTTDSLIQITDLTTGLGQFNYVWDFGDGNFSTDISPSHVYLSPGTYTITQMVTWRCTTDANMQAVTLNFSGINNMAAPVIKVFPVPADESLQIYFSWNGNKKIELIDQLGRSCMPDQIFSENKTRLDIRKLKSGIYILKITLDDQRTYHTKVMKN